MSKVVVATQKGGLDDQVSPVFGRCQTYTIVEIEGDEVKGAEVVQNQYANAMSGAGIQAAGFVANQGADAVISGNFGPNVASVLNQSGVDMIQSSGGSVKEAVQKYLNGQLQPVTQATSQPMSGSGRGMGRGMGQGMARQQPGQQSTGSPSRQPGQSYPSGQSQKKENDRIQNLENRMKELEG